MTISLNTNRKSAPAFLLISQATWWGICASASAGQNYYKKSIDEGGHQELLLLLWYGTSGEITACRPSQLDTFF